MKHTLLFNGMIYSMEQQQPFDWILLAGNSIAALGHKGNRPHGSDLIGEKRDLEGKTVLPAFADGHLHIIPTAMKLEQIDLEPCTSPAEVIDLLKRKKPAETGGWILGAGFNKNLWKQASPHRSQLDALYPDTPVALASKDLHQLWVNTRALQEAGVSRETPDPEYGRVERDTDGTPSGILYESACEKVFRLFNEVGFEQLESLLKSFSAHFYKLGITMVNAIEEPGTWQQLQMLNRRGKLPIRITCHLPHKHLENLAAAGLQSGFGDEWLRLGGVKFFTDGSLGSQTADLFESYASNPGYTGISTMSEEMLTERLTIAARAGLSGIVHAIGNRAVNKTLNAYSHTLEWQNKYGLIQRMEHAQLINQEDLPRFSEYGIIASMQPSHIADDVEIADFHWGELARHAYPQRSLIDHGVTISLGSDSPVADPNPFRNIYCAVERKYLANPANKSWHPENAITLQEAVEAHTVNVARVSYTDSYLGTLTAGKRADLIVIDRNIFENPIEELLEAKVLMTYMDGKLVYSD